MLKTGCGLAIALAGWLAACGPAQAVEPIISDEGVPGNFSANVALTSEYVFRGISQTDGNPAIQGGFDYGVSFFEGEGAVKDAGAYLGVWASNVKFTDANIETDVYGGLNTTVLGVGLDAGFIYYLYPGASSALNYDFVEIKLAASYDFGLASATASVNYSPEYFGESGEAWYPALGVEVPIGRYFALTGHVGYQDIEDNAAFGADDYLDYSVGGTVNLFGFDVTAAWTDTDLDSEQCDDLCGIATLTVSRSF